MIFLLPIVSVWAGFVIALLLKPKNEQGIQLLLAFSGAFLLSLTFFELLPEVYEGNDSKEIAVYILIGILLQIFLEYFSKGAEHGHTHKRIQNTSFPLGLFLGLSVHAFVEGIPIEEGRTILYGIIVHKLPVAIILSSLLINSHISRTKSIIFIAAFSLMTPLGTYFTTYTDLILPIGSQVNAIAIGVFLHVSAIILFESSSEHKFNLGKFITICLGALVAYFLYILVV